MINPAILSQRVHDKLEKACLTAIVTETFMNALPFTTSEVYADAKKYTSQSNEPITVICPHCKTTKECIISNIYLYKSIGCSCGDGKSYPEKFIYYAFKQLGECFETEYSPEYSYDDSSRDSSKDLSCDSSLCSAETVSDASLSSDDVLSSANTNSV